MWFSSSVLQTSNIHVRCADSCRPVQSEDGIGLVGNSRKNRENQKERKCETVSGFRSFGLSRFSWFIRQHRADDVAICGDNAQSTSIPVRIWFRLCRAVFHPCFVRTTNVEFARALRGFQWMPRGSGLVVAGATRPVAGPASDNDSPTPFCWFRLRRAGFHPWLRIDQLITARCLK